MAIPLKFKTGRLARYHGKGDDPFTAILGSSAPANSPFHYFPMFPSGNPNFVFRSFNSDAGIWQGSAEVGAAGSQGATVAGYVMTCDAADNDNQWLSMFPSFTPAAGKVAFFYTRLMVSDDDQVDVFAGFWATDADPTSTEPTHGAYFKKDDGDTILNGKTNDGGVGTETANLLTNFAASTEYDLGVVIHETSRVTFHWKLASAVEWNVVEKLTDLPAAAVRASWFVQNGEGVAKVMTITDYAYGWMR